MSSAGFSFVFIFIPEVSGSGHWQDGGGGGSEQCLLVATDWDEMIKK